MPLDMMNQGLFTTKQWESAKPSSVVFDEIHYSKGQPGKVSSVRGFIKLRKKVHMSDGHTQRKPCVRRADWDSSGRCFLGDFRIRGQKYDIPLKG